MTTNITTKERILLESKAWVMEKLALDKEYFSRLASMHTPEILWIGSIDSLIPVREITNTDPGEILTYRNVGNIIKENDHSFMAVLEDALEVSKVKHIIICGYSHCSSLRDTIMGTGKPRTQEWLSELKSLYDSNLKEFEGLSLEDKEEKLCRMNIMQQIKNLAGLSLIKKCWKENNYPTLYGWYFDLKTGSFSEVASHENN
jgi:carbonic anhydrase